MSKQFPERSDFGDNYWDKKREYKKSYKVNPKQKMLNKLKKSHRVSSFNKYTG